MADARTEVDKKIQRTDYSSPTAAGEFKLRDVILTSPSNPTNPVDMSSATVFLELDIYEDLFSNVLRATFTFVDATGLPETLPIVGDETLTVTFTTPSAEGTSNQTADLDATTKNEEVLEQKFRVYDIERTGQEERANIYTLFMVSEEYVQNLKIRLSRTLRGKYSDMVPSVLAQLNKTLDTRKKFYVEETASLQNITIPNWTPFQAINFFASRSISSDTDVQDVDGNNPSVSGQKPKGSLFFFYEKLGTGFFYQSLESLILKQKARQNIPTFVYTPKLTGERTGNLELNYFAVDTFEIKSSFRTLENLGYGMFASKLIAYDPVRMKYDVINYDYYDSSTSPNRETVDTDSGVTTVREQTEQLTSDANRVFNDFVGTDTSITTGEKNKLVSKNSDLLNAHNSAIRLATTTRNHDLYFVPLPKNANTSSYVTGKLSTEKTFNDPTAKSNRVEDWLLQRDVQLKEFDSIVVNFTVAGNTSRHVGDLVKFEVPSYIPEDEQGLVPSHQLYGGYYLISKIRHIITRDEHKMDVELIKNSFNKRILGQTEEIATQ